jgi:putative transcriptional regulator
MTARADIDDLFREHETALAEAAATVLEPVAPRPELRARLLADLEGPQRFRPFFAELGRLLALPVTALESLLARIDDVKSFRGVLPGIGMLSFTPGAGAAGREAAILRLGPGVRFPSHQHLGDELAFVLEGAGHDDDGQSYGPGATIAHAADTSHGFTAGARRDLVLVVLHSGIKLVG